MADRWISPTGSDAATGLNSGVPKKTFAACTSLLAAGDTLWVMDGTYTPGTTGMISVVSGTSGTFASPISIKAVNEGNVLLDGQMAGPCAYISSTNWWTIQGLNMCKGGNGYNGQAAVISIIGYGNYLKNIVAWDMGNSPGGNGDVCHVSSGAAATAYRAQAANTEGPLIEDCAFFGTARYTFSNTNSASPSYATWRRVYARWDWSDRDGPKACTNSSYGVARSRFENCILHMRGEGVPAGNYNIYTYGNPPVVEYSTSEGSGVGHNHYTDANGSLVAFAAFVEWYGCLFLLKSDDKSYSTFYNQYCYQTSFKDCVWWTAPEKSTRPAIRLYTSHGATTGMTITNMTLLGGSVTDGNYQLSSEFVQSGNILNNRTSAYAAGFGGYPSAADNLYLGATGSKIRYKYVDSVLSGTALWPWPMQSRIRAASITAQTINDGLYAKTITIDVDNDIQTIFGPYPGSVFVLSPTTVPSGIVNSVYAGATLSTTGGTGPYTYAVTAGALPTGIVLSSGGVLSGTPTGTPTTYNFTVTSTDTITPFSTGVRTYDLVVAPAVTGGPFLVIAHRATATATQTTGSSITITKPAGTVDGDVMVATILGDCQAYPADCTITPPAGWTVAATYADSPVRMTTYYKKALSEGANYVFTFTSGGQAVGAIGSYTNVDQTTQIDGTPTVYYATNVAVQNIKSTVADTIGAMQIGAAGWFSGVSTGTFTPPSGMTERADVSVDSAAYGKVSMERVDQLLVTSGATGDKTGTASITSNSGAITHSLVLRPASGGAVAARAFFL